MQPPVAQEAPRNRRVGRTISLWRELLQKDAASQLCSRQMGFPRREGLGGLRLWNAEEKAPSFSSFSLFSHHAWKSMQIFSPGQTLFPGKTAAQAALAINS